jgi:hypothetical protein
VDKVGVVHLEGHAAAVMAVVLEGAVDVQVEVEVEVEVEGEEAVVKSYLKKILMLIWRSIMKKQSRTIEGIYHVYCLAITIFCGHLLFGDVTTSFILCISTKILLLRQKRKNYP